MTYPARTFDFHGRTLPTRFESYSHYDQVMQSLEEDPEIESVTVLKPATSVGFEEFWFRLIGSRDTIRIVKRDAPFEGIIETVPTADLS